MRLNGWQRIGVIVSVLWIVGGFLWGNSWYLSSQDAPVASEYRLCEAAADQKQQNYMQEAQAAQESNTPLRTTDTWNADDAKCQQEMNSGFIAATKGHWLAASLFAIFPLLFAWGLAWIVMRLYRWVRTGFASPRA